MTLPATIELNAGQACVADTADRANRWGARTENMPDSQQQLDLGTPADPTDWRRADVGYGILLPDSAASPADKAAALDAAGPVRELLKARPDTVVLRWSPQLPPGFVRRYYPDGTSQDPGIGVTTFGTARGLLPRYVSIIATPAEIPWRVQYDFETRHAVGRVPLAGDALGNYLQALVDDWRGCEIDVRAPVVWTVSTPGDITDLMRTVVADPLVTRLTDPTLPDLRTLGAASATAAQLLGALTAAHPAFVATSSHGLAVAAPDALRAGLGTPLDCTGTPVDLAALTASVPGGAVWYSQACCSAGSDAVTNYAGLIASGPVLDTLTAVAALGATVAPACLALLGRDRPVRAVFGHVEPTFDWTLRVAETGQALGGDLVAGMSTNLFAGQPLGYVLDAYRAGVGVLQSQWAELRAQLDNGDTSVRDRLTRLRLSAIDRQSLVLLGDPTVTLPKPD
jgi:hypothetical protein